MTYSVIPCQMGEHGAMYAANERILDPGDVPSYHFDPAPEYKVARVSTWPLYPAGACDLTYRCNMSDQYVTTLSQHPAITPTFYLEKFLHYIDDPTVAPVASISSDENGPYEIPFGTYTFKFSYLTPEGQSLLSPASNAVSIDAENQWVDLEVAPLSSEYNRNECVRRVWVSRNGGPYEADAYGWYFSYSTFEWYYPELLSRGQPTENTTGTSTWGWAELYPLESHAIVENTVENLQEVFGWDHLVPGCYRLTVTYPAWSIPYTYFTFRGLEQVDEDEFRVYPNVSSKNLTYAYYYQADFGWVIGSDWSWTNCKPWDQIQDAAELLAAQRSWDESFGGHYEEAEPHDWVPPPMGVVESYDWEIIYQTGDVFESTDDTRGFKIVDGARRGRPCVEVGAGEWVSLGIKTATRPVSVGQYGYEFQGPYTYDEMQPVADLLHEKDEHSGTGIPWIRYRVGDTEAKWDCECVGYGWFQAYSGWAPAQCWGRIINVGNALDFLHTPTNYPTTPWEADPDQWELPS